MKIIDAHINLTRDGKWYNTDHDASVETALRQMDKAGIEMAGVVPISGADNRDFTLELASKQSDRFFTGFAISSLDDGEFSTLREHLGHSPISFLKIHPRTTGIVPLDPRLERFLGAAQAHDIPVMFCGYVRGGKVAMSDITPFVYDDLARKWPDLKIIISHAGSYRVMDAIAVSQSHQNVYLDVSHVMKYFAGSSVELDLMFMFNRLDRKVLYGSDFPEFSIDEYLNYTQSKTMELVDFDANSVYGGLAEHLFKLHE